MAGTRSEKASDGVQDNVPVEVVVGNPEPGSAGDVPRTAPLEDGKVKVTLSQHVDLDENGETASMGSRGPFKAYQPMQEITLRRDLANAFIKAGYTTVDPDNAAEVAKVLGD